MKLTEEQITKYDDDFHIECSFETLKKDWHFDKQHGFQTISDSLFTKRYINLKTVDDDWLRIPFDELTQEQIEALLMDD